MAIMFPDFNSFGDSVDSLLSSSLIDIVIYLQRSTYSLVISTCILVISVASMTQTI